MHPACSPHAHSLPAHVHVSRLVLRVEAALLEEAGRRVVSVGEQVQHAQGEGVLLEPREQPRPHAVALLLLAHDAEGDLEEAARAVRLDDDSAQHAAHLPVG